MKMWGNLSVLGQLALTQGDYELARDRWEEAAQIAHDMKEGRKETLTRGFLAYLARDYEEGKSLCEKAAEMSRESGEKGDAAACLIWAAYCAEGAGDLSGARVDFHESLLIARGLESGSVLWSEVPALNGLGRTARAGREFSEAERFHGEALGLSQKRSDREGVAVSLEELGAAAAGRLEFERAARLFGAAQRLRDEIGAVTLPHLSAPLDATIDSVRAEMSAEVCQKAWEAWPGNVADGGSRVRLQIIGTQIGRPRRGGLVPLDPYIRPVTPVLAGRGACFLQR